MKINKKRDNSLLGFGGTLSQYSGKCVGVVNKKIVAIGRDAIDVFEKVKKKFPEKKEGIGIYYIPTKEEIITALWNFPIWK